MWGKELGPDLKDVSSTILSRRSPCLGRSSFARQKRKQFRGEFALLQTVTNLSRRAHRSSLGTLRTGCERPLR
jgi:hypothetical protein